MRSKINFPPHVPAFVRNAASQPGLYETKQPNDFGDEWRDRYQALISLVCDDRMSEVFKIFKTEKLAEKKVQDFIIVAWSSSDDFNYGDWLRDALRLRKQVCNQSLKLKKLIKALQDTGAFLPYELLHPNNLAPIDGYSSAHANIRALRAMRMANNLGLNKIPPDGGRARPWISARHHFHSRCHRGCCLQRRQGVSVHSR